MFYCDNKLTRAYEDMGIYYIPNVVNLIRASVILIDHLEGGVLRRIYYKYLKISAQI
jgi:hypothetical protein